MNEEINNQEQEVELDVNKLMQVRLEKLEELLALCKKVKEIAIMESAMLHVGVTFNGTVEFNEYARGEIIVNSDEVAKLLDAPIITGKTTNSERDVLYKKFREGEIRVLVVSKVANFAIDLPDASMAIQISGTFGSRQEEAQRLGRILRPKERTSRFFTLITRDTVEENFGANRQKFLAEQGYSYKLIRNIEQLEEF